MSYWPGALLSWESCLGVTCKHDTLVSPWSPYLVGCPSRDRIQTHLIVNASSGSSACSPSRRRPLVTKAWRLYKAWTVQPKWHPWCMRGSLLHLNTLLRTCLHRKLLLMVFCKGPAGERSAVVAKFPWCGDGLYSCRYWAWACLFSGAIKQTLGSEVRWVIGKTTCLMDCHDPRFICKCCGSNGLTKTSCDDFWHAHAVSSSRGWVRGACTWTISASWSSKHLSTVWKFERPNKE